MKDWLLRFFKQIKSVWGKWAFFQKLLFLSVIGVGVIGIALLVIFSSSPSRALLFGVAIEDQDLQNRILIKLDQENISYKVTADKRIYVDDIDTARRMRALLIREDLVPAGLDPWSLFDVERWTLTDFERDINLRRALTANLIQHIQSLRDVDAANVTLVLPERTLFEEDQNPVTVSVVITPRPGSDIVENKAKIEGIVKLIQFAVEGLSEENITITDYNGIVLNDFTGLEEVDRLEVTKRMLRQKRNLEAQYIRTIRASLQKVFTAKRVDIMNIDINLKFDKRQVDTEEHYPVTMREDDPKTPYSEREVTPSITLSTTTTDEKFEGTGFNPEGPPGQEGQTPPSYKDLSNLVGKYQKNSEVRNEVVNKRNIREEKSPFSIDRVTVGVAIDGVWRWSYNEKGKPIIEKESVIKRAYTPVLKEDLKKAKTLVEHAVGYDPARGDSVTVQHIPFDHTERFLEEDRSYIRQQQIYRGIVYSIVGLALILIGFILFRIVMKVREHQRRLREEALARQQRLLREAALQEMEESEEGSLTPERDMNKARLQEDAINAARDNPAEVVQLLRTWMAQE